MSERLRITYELTCARDESPEAKARGIALEQTVELPDSTLPEDIRERMVGRIEALEPIGRRHRTTISYPVDAIGGELTQLLNLLFGNISLQSGIRVTAIDWPDALLTALGGPGHGVSGLRALTGVRDRALLCTALKPLGMSPEALAERARAFALGGMDLIKDDHGLADQPPAPFLERLQRCQEAVIAANAATGGSALYLPNVTAGPGELPARLWAAREAGCRAVLISPWLTGADALRRARDDYASHCWPIRRSPAPCSGVATASRRSWCWAICSAPPGRMPSSIPMSADASAFPGRCAGASTSICGLRSGPCVRRCRRPAAAWTRSARRSGCAATGLIPSC